MIVGSFLFFVREGIFLRGLVVQKEWWVSTLNKTCTYTVNILRSFNKKQQNIS
jgi:hypothetical protein